MSTKGRAGKQGRRQKGTGAAGPEAAAEAAVHSASQGYREQLGVKGQKPSKEERKLAAEAERQRRAELELLLMDDTALRDASVAGKWLATNRGRLAMTKESKAMSVKKQSHRFIVGD